jgi:hypothetical protein
MTMTWHASHGDHVLNGADRPYHVVRAGSHWLADAWRTRRAPFMATFVSLDAAKAACEADARSSVPALTGDAQRAGPVPSEKTGPHKQS